MPILTVALIGGIIRIALTAIGVGLVSFIGVEALLSSVTSIIRGGLGSSGAVAGFAGLMGVDRAISLVLSGYSVRVALSAMRRFTLL
jgi:hypothetical protein